MASDQELRAHMHTHLHRRCKSSRVEWRGHMHTSRVEWRGLVPSRASSATADRVSARISTTMHHAETTTAITSRESTTSRRTWDACRAVLYALPHTHTQTHTRDRMQVRGASGAACALEDMLGWGGGGRRDSVLSPPQKRATGRATETLPRRRRNDASSAPGSPHL